MRIHDLINEIKELKPGNARKCAFDVYNILENNRVLFLQHLEESNFRMIVTNFEELANASAKDFASTHYKEQVERNYNLLTFYLDKVI